MAATAENGLVDKRKVKENYSFVVSEITRQLESLKIDMTDITKKVDMSIGYLKDFWSDYFSFDKEYESDLILILDCKTKWNKYHSGSNLKELGGKALESIRAHIFNIHENYDVYPQLKGGLTSLENDEDYIKDYNNSVLSSYNSLSIIAYKYKYEMLDKIVNNKG